MKNYIQGVLKLKNIYTGVLKLKKNIYIYIYIGWAKI